MTCWLKTLYQKHPVARNGKVWSTYLVRQLSSALQLLDAIQGFLARGLVLLQQTATEQRLRDYLRRREPKSTTSAEQKRRLEEWLLDRTRLCADKWDHTFGDQCLLSSIQDDMSRLPALGADGWGLLGRVAKTAKLGQRLQQRRANAGWRRWLEEALL